MTIAVSLEPHKCCICSKPATSAYRAAIPVPSTAADSWMRYEPDPEGATFWCDDHDPEQKKYRAGIDSLLKGKKCEVCGKPADRALVGGGEIKKTWCIFHAPEAIQIELPKRV